MGRTTYSVVQNVPFSSEFDTVRVLVLCGTAYTYTLHTEPYIHAQRVLYRILCTQRLAQITSYRVA